MEVQLSITPMRNHIAFYTDAEGGVIPLLNVRNLSKIKPSKDGNIYVKVTIEPEEDNVPTECDSNVSESS